MGSTRLDLSGKINPELIDHFDSLPDSLLLSIFNRIGDFKTLGRCGVVSSRFHSLVPQVDNVIVQVDRVIPDDPAPSSAASSGASAADKSRNPVSSLFRVVFSGLFKPVQSLITSSPRCHSVSSNSESLNGATHHSPTQVLKNFKEIKLLKIELPSEELGIDEGILLKWKANFGSTLDNCVILGASSVSQSEKSLEFCGVNNGNGNGNGAENDNGESFYRNRGLKWTISSLIAASARHYLVEPIIAEHETVKRLVLTDGDGQGVLCMNEEQLEELRAASSASKRTVVPALNVRLWYAPHLELPNGMVLKGATLVAIRPSEQPKESEGNWVVSAFEEPFGTAARMLVKRSTCYSLEKMNSFF